MFFFLSENEEGTVFVFFKRRADIILMQHRDKTTEKVDYAKFVSH